MTSGEELDPPGAVWVGGQGAYAVYRIPALLCADDGTVLAFCEGRVAGRGDSGQIDLLLRRSTDRGYTWGPTQVVVSWPGFTVGNPTPVMVRETGEVVLVFCANESQAHESTIRKGLFQRTVWIVTSEDRGATWGTPRDITAQAKNSEWTWYATGPGHAIQLSSGRLLVPCNHRHLDTEEVTLSRHSHVIYSDDQGATWQIGGGIGDEGANESTAAEMCDGSIYLNSRDQHGRGLRFVARSTDGGRSFHDVHFDEILTDPPCQGTALSVADLSTSPLLFLSPGGPGRKRLTARLSLDNGHTWPCAKVIDPGHAAYSDVTQLTTTSPQGVANAAAEILALYETGVDGDCERLQLVRLTVHSSGDIEVSH